MVTRGFGVNKRFGGNKIFVNEMFDGNRRIWWLKEILVGMRWV